MRRDSVGAELRCGAVALVFVATCLVGWLSVSVARASGPVAGESGDGSEGIDAFNMIGPTICGRNPATKGGLDSLMVESGFKRTAGWWSFTEIAGTTKVSAMLPAAKLVAIVFVPARREPLPQSIVEAMTAKAQSVSFVPPDKMSFEFAEIAKLEGCRTSNEVIVSLKDGSWLETDQTMRWGGKP